MPGTNSTPMKDLLKIPKPYRTPFIIEAGLRKNGCQLQDLDEDELTEELVHIAVEQNGFVYDKVPAKYKTKLLLRQAILSTDGIIISEYMSGCELDEDLQLLLVNYGYGFIYHVSNVTQKAFDAMFDKHYGIAMYEFIANNGGYIDVIRKYLKHYHIVDYFKRQEKIEESLYIKKLHMMTDNVTMKLMLDIYAVSPNTYYYLKTVPGFDNELRKVLIDEVLVDLE